MATINRFEDLEIWKEARRLAHIIHIISVETNLNSDFRLKSQVNASSGSVMDNIAEGFERMEILNSGNFLLSRKVQRVKHARNYTAYWIADILPRNNSLN